MNTLYSTKNVKTADDTPTFIDGGIQENLSLVEVKFDTTPNNNEFLAFYFVNENGDKLSHTEWPVRLSKPLSAMTEDEANRYHAIVDMQVSRIKQIIETFHPKGSYKEIEAESFKEFAEEVTKLLQNQKDVKVRVKVVYNDRGFTTLPRDSRHTFIEPMSVPKEESKIRQLPSDRFVRPVLVPDREDNVTNQFASETTEAESSGDKSDGDLPF